MVENLTNEKSGSDITAQLEQKCESAFPDTLSLFDRVYRELPGVNPARHSVDNVELYKNNNKQEQLDLAEELGVKISDNFLSRLKAGRACATILNERDEAPFVKENAKKTVDKLEEKLNSGNQKDSKVTRIGQGIVNTAIANNNEHDWNNPLNNIYSPASYRPDLPNLIIQPDMNKNQKAIYDEIKSRPGLEAEIKPYKGSNPMQHHNLPDFWITAHKTEK